MSAESKFKHECIPKNAQRFWQWIKTRGGVAVWKSINLSNPGGGWSTPANDKDGKPYTKPNWQCGSTPTIYTDAREIGVGEPVLFVAFPVKLKRSGLSLNLSDTAQRRLDEELDKCRERHGNAYYEKGVLDIDGASMGVFYDASITPLDEWIAKYGEGTPEEWID